MKREAGAWYEGKSREELIEYCEALMMECDDLRSQLLGDDIPQYSDHYAEVLSDEGEAVCNK